MTEEQRRDALALCDRILETAARAQADLREAKAVIDDEMVDVLPPSGHSGSGEASVRKFRCFTVSINALP